MTETQTDNARKPNPLYSGPLDEIAAFLDELRATRKGPTAAKLYRYALALLTEVRRLRADREPMAERMKALGTRIAIAESRAERAERLLGEIAE